MPYPKQLRYCGQVYRLADSDDDLDEIDRQRHDYIPILWIASADKNRVADIIKQHGWQHHGLFDQDWTPEYNEHVCNYLRQRVPHPPGFDYPLRIDVWHDVATELERRYIKYTVRREATRYF
jgi:hypothetical protein